VRACERVHVSLSLSLTLSLSLFTGGWHKRVQTLPSGKMGKC